MFRCLCWFWFMHFLFYSSYLSGSLHIHIRTIERNRRENKFCWKKNWVKWCLRFHILRNLIKSYFLLPIYLIYEKAKTKSIILFIFLLFVISPPTPKRTNNLEIRICMKKKFCEKEEKLFNLIMIATKNLFHVWFMAMVKKRRKKWNVYDERKTHFSLSFIHSHGFLIIYGAKFNKNIHVDDKFNFAA